MSEVQLNSITEEEFVLWRAISEAQYKLGLRHIGLHVFGHNKVARNLYIRLGYEITNLNMEKVL